MVALAKQHRPYTRGGLVLAQKGYSRTHRPLHPLAGRDGYVYSHRLALYERIGPGLHKCHHCGKFIAWFLRWPDSPHGLTVDHVVASKIDNRPASLVPSCGQCNSRMRFVRERRRQRRRAA